MSVLLKDGTEVEDPRLGRVELFDPASRNYAISEKLDDEALLRSKTWLCRPRHNQGQEGACVLFGWGHELSALPFIIQGIKEADLFDWYHVVQHKDPWDGCALGPDCHVEPGPRYEGTAVLTGAQHMVELGYIEEYRWVFNGVLEMARTIAQEGPVVAGVNWHRGMADPDSNGWIHPVGPVDGGHAVCVRGVRIVRIGGQIDWDRSYFIIRNSWGIDWGFTGDCRISFTNMQKLLDARGEVCVPMIRKRP